MIYFKLCIRFLILLMSFYGYIQTVKKKIPLELAIGFLFASIGSIVFLSGILNIMQEVTWIICLIGCILGVQSLIKKDNILDLLKPSTVFFCVICICLLLGLKGKVFHHYDDFSHWATSLKILLTTNRFPNFQDINITFQSYPLGHASFIYYVAQIVPIRSEWFFMWIQATLICGFLISLFAFSKSPTQLLASAFIFLFLLFGNTRLSTLLVDTLLPAVALAAFCTCLHFSGREEPISLWVTPYCIFLIAVKNSGLLFALFIYIAVVTFRRSKEEYKYLFTSVFFSIFTLILWQRHVDLVFDAGLSTKHAMTFENFQKVFESKTVDTFITISKAFLNSSITLNNGIIVFFLLIPVSSLIFTKRFLGASNFRLFRAVYAYCCIVYALYMISLLGMYFFTMPEYEATKMAGFDRYHNSILIYVGGTYFPAYMAFEQKLSNQETHSLKQRSLIFTVICVLCSFLAITPYFLGSSDTKTEQWWKSTRHDIEMIIEDYQIKSDCNYLLLAEENFRDPSFVRYLIKYLLNPKLVQVSLLEDLGNKEIDYGSFDYVIAIDNSPAVMRFIKEEFNTELPLQVFEIK